MDISRSMPVVKDEIRPYGIVYRITNLVNGKYYIGQTTKELEVRWYQHSICYRKKTGRGSTRLNASIKHHGSENFKAEILCECPNQESLDAAEVFFIWFSGSMKEYFGYNLHPGGHGGSPTPETREKIRKKLLGNIPHNLGKPASEEQKRKQSEMMTGRKASDETRKKMSDSSKERIRPPCSEETKRKISEKNKGRRDTDEQRKKKSDSHLLMEAKKREAKKDEQIKM